MISRREVLIGAGAVGSAAMLSRVAKAEAKWPARPITITIANAPGGDDDTLSRFLAETLTSELGQAVVIENRGGGSTTIGVTAASSAKPDGYNFLCLPTSGLVQTVLRDKLPYTLDSFTPIVGIGGYPLALIASKKAGINTIDDLMAAVHSPEGVTFASAGVGTIAHLTGTAFIKEAKGKGINVSYKNNPDGIQGIAGGFTQMMFVSAREGAILKDDENVKVLAVTSAARTSNLPDVPTTTEIGYPQIDGRVWYGYLAPAGVPEEVVARFAAAVVKGVQDPKFQDRFGPLSFHTDLKTGEEFTAFLRSEQDRFRKIITENDIKLNN
ncbi:Bug family tripartite tricarboxylate transporter substrate binding protein [Rhizobium leguminosarum]|uniref:Bug family tripartite tricarboxylate transporter substrate binding protein n=1 Tax=Rhizobium leguminosarum TaxID=384 RepID=UPI0013F22667|nr:tripartite tricarboxylate transporter substrate binding protein [Rhizobium leguminosarum]